MVRYIYLASPYSHEKEDIREFRYMQVREATAQLLNEGVPVFSPIVHCHELAKHHDLPKDAEFWKFYNRTMLKWASELWLLLLLGWRESTGMESERAMAIEFDIWTIHGYYPSMKHCARRDSPWRSMWDGVVLQSTTSTIISILPELLPSTFLSSWDLLPSSAAGSWIVFQT